MEIAHIPAYELEEERKLEEVNSQAYVLRHKKSGEHAI